MKKEDLEKFKELYEVIEEKAIEISEIKNKYSERPVRYYDDDKFEYSDGEFGVKLIERGRCGSSDDDSKSSSRGCQWNCGRYRSHTGSAAGFS